VSENPLVKLEIPPYPERSFEGNYPATAVAMFAGGFERDLVSWGAPCSGHDRPDGKAYCKSTDTYLDAGRPHCVNHLIRYCQHRRSDCFECPKDRPAPTITQLTEIRSVRAFDRVLLDI
jgi:hypothetical protein